MLCFANVVHTSSVVYVCVHVFHIIFALTFFNSSFSCEQVFKQAYMCSLGFFSFVVLFFFVMMGFGVCVVWRSSHWCSWY